VVHVHNFADGALNPVLAYVMSCVGCFLGLRCATRGNASHGAAKARWLVLATVAIATTGIWVMHFIAMLGFAIPGQTIRYNVPVTLLSMLIAVMVVGAGLFITGFSRRGGGGPLLAGGLVVGLGVASMHYLGMAAIRVPDTLSYNPVLVVASVVIAVIAGTAALWAALRLDSAWSAFGASLIMGVAVSGMHYTGMAALQVYADPALAATAQGGVSAEAFLLPLLMGISSVAFILTIVISLAPTAAEMVEEAGLMARIGRPAPQGPPPDRGQYQDRGRYQDRNQREDRGQRQNRNQRQDRGRRQDGGRPEWEASPEQETAPEPGSLFRPRHSRPPQD
jgi:NO-binding membrane sensor protein with MHYT domain